MKRLVTLAALVAAVALIGCQKGNFSERTNQTQSAGNVLRYAIPTNPTSLDCAVVQDGDTLDILQNVYEGLVGWDENNNVVGLLAESWELKEGGKVYEFKLRPNVKFHNGKPLTAEDVKWSLERACHPAVKSQTAGGYLGDIVGVDEVVAGKATTISGIKVVSPDRVSIEIKKPIAYFLGKFTFLASAVVPKGDLPIEEIKDPKQAIGTGPFKMAQYVPQQLTVLEANADYWGGKPKLDKIERPVVIDSSTRLNKFKSGELDLLILQRQDVASIKKDAELSKMLVNRPRPATWYVAMNQLQYEPFKKREVRQAFAMAIDKDKIINELFEGLNPKANGIVPKGIKGSDRPDAKNLPFDPAAAKKLLADAGFPDGSKMPPLTLTFREGYADAKLLSEAVATMLTQNLGVKVSAQAMEWRSLLDKQGRKEIPFYHLRWAADYLDPQNYLSYMLTTTGPENKCGYSNPEYDKLCEQADSLPNMEDRLPLYAKAEDIVLQDAPWVPIYFQSDYELVRPRVKNMREAVFGHLPHTTTAVTP